MKFEVYQLGDVAFDPTTRALTFPDGSTAPLRNKSKEVLICLLEAPNDTVTKEHILKTVWSDVTVSDESVVQCIADIRRLIGEDGHQIVETVPREGYRLNPPAQSEQSPPPNRRIAFGAIASVAVVIGAWLLWPVAPISTTAQGSVDIEIANIPNGTNKDAYLEVLKGRASAHRFSLSESLAAERHFRTAIDLDPSYARAYAELGTLLAVRFENDWSVIEEADKDKALFYAKKAETLDPDLWLAQYALGRLHSVFANLELAEKHLGNAMALEPGNEDARAYYGVVKNFQGDAESAAAILDQAVRSHPNPPYWYYFGLGHALFNARRFEQAEAALNQCLTLDENSPYCLRYLIAVHGETGDLARAETVSRAYSSMGFDLSVGSILKLIPFHHPDDQAQLKTALHRAGLPD
ncbi:MAG: winged helix-turn-helix domain-containing protein [Paracoccaceae bacterium]